MNVKKQIKTKMNNLKSKSKQKTVKIDHTDLDYLDEYYDLDYQSDNESENNINDELNISLDSNSDRRSIKNNENKLETRNDNTKDNKTFINKQIAQSPKVKNDNQNENKSSIITKTTIESTSNINKSFNILRGMCKVNGKTRYYIFDTGAENSIMDYRLFKHLNMNEKYFKKSRDKFCSANQTFQTRGLISLSFEIGAYEFDADVLVVYDLIESHEIILGMNAINSCPIFKQLLMPIYNFIQESTCLHQKELANHNNDNKSKR